MKVTRSKAVLLSTGILVAILYVLKVGYFYSYIDHNERSVFFVKKFLTTRREFVNPYAYEAEQIAVSEMPPQLLSEFISYCKYAYGITSGDRQSLDECRLNAIKDAF